VKTARQDLPAPFVRDRNIRNEARPQRSPPGIEFGGRDCTDALIVIEQSVSHVSSSLSFHLPTRLKQIRPFCIDANSFIFHMKELHFQRAWFQALQRLFQMQTKPR
jgi:hypothetical protein